MYINLDQPLKCDIKEKMQVREYVHDITYLYDINMYIKYINV